MNETKKSVTEKTLKDLRSRLRGRLLMPGGAAYEEARTNLSDRKLES